MSISQNLPSFNKHLSAAVSVLQLVDGPAVIEVVGDAVDIEAGGTAED